MYSGLYSLIKIVTWLFFFFTLLKNLHYYNNIHSSECIQVQGLHRINANN